MIKTTYNPHLEKYRQAEVNYIKTHSAASSEQSHHNNNEGFSPLGMYALIQQTAGNLDSTLEDMLEKARACKDSDIGKFVQEHSASIVRKVRA